MRVRIYKDRASKGAVALSRATGYKCLKIQGSKFRPRNDDVIINWGCTSLPDYIIQSGCSIINRPDKVQVACDKLQSFHALTFGNVPVPDFTTDKQVAQHWLQTGTVLERHMLRASSGRGIQIRSPGDELQNAPLYVKYVKKKDEYRVHVLDGRVLDIQRKMRKHEVPDDQVNWKIRNHCNGFVFGRNGNDATPEGIGDVSIQAVTALGLSFGAVDLIWNQHHNQWYVLEVNTAPGLEGTTLDNYKSGLTALFE